MDEKQREEAANKDAAEATIEEHLRERMEFWHKVAREEADWPHAESWRATAAGAEAEYVAWGSRGEWDDLTAEMVATLAEWRFADAFATVERVNGRMNVNHVLDESLKIWRGLEALGYTITQSGR